MEMEDGFDMSIYLSLTGGLPDDVNATANLNILNSLVYRHVSRINYQNYDLLTGKEILPMTPDALLRRTLVNKRGGMCYETSELMFHVLRQFGFDVRRVPVSVLNDMEYQPTEPLVHNILIVHLEGRMYIVDVGFGYNSIRCALNFSFETTEEKTVMPGEKYQLLCEKDFYQLNIFIKGKFASLYRFPRPIPYINYEESMAFYRGLVTMPQTTVIRDSVIFIGVILEKGRYCFSCDYSDKGATNFTFMSILDGATEKSKVSVDEFVRLVEKHSGFSIEFENVNGEIKFLKVY